MPSNASIFALVMTLPAWAPFIGNCPVRGVVAGANSRIDTAVPSCLPVTPTSAPTARSAGVPLPSVKIVAESGTSTLRQPVLVATVTVRPSMMSTSPLTTGLFGFGVPDAVGPPAPRTPGAVRRSRRPAPCAWP